MASNAKYRIFVRDSSFVRVGEIKDFTKLELVLRFNNVGTWKLDLPELSEEAIALAQPGAGVIVTRNGVTILSGPVTLRERSWNKNENKIVFSGMDDLAWLLRRLVLPSAGPLYTSSAYDVRSGIAETVMKAYVTANLGSGAAVGRALVGLTVAPDLTRGGSVIGRGRFQTLLELITQLAIDGGQLGFRLVQSGAGLSFDVYQTTDRSNTVKFSKDLRNLAAYSYSGGSPKANYIICGGSGDGTARVFSENGDLDSILNFGRIETFRDRRDTTVAAELTDTVDSELIQQGSQVGLSITPLDTPDLGYLNPYQVGDTIAVVVDGETITDVVRELKLNVDKNGEVVSPTVGTQSAATVLGFFRQLKDITTRLTLQERH